MMQYTSFVLLWEKTNTHEIDKMKDAKTKTHNLIKQKTISSRGYPYQPITW